MEVRLHDGTVVTVPPDGITLGRGSPACWTDPAISRQQAQLLPVQGIQDLLKLKNMGMNGTNSTRCCKECLTIAALALTNDSAGVPWELKDLLDQGQETMIDPNCRFYVLGKMGCTMTLVVAGEVDVGNSPPPKRQKRQEERRLPCPSSETSFQLLAVGALGAAAPDPRGVQLRDVVCGPVQLAVVSNYMVDLPWLMSACPALREATHLVVVHGEHGEREAALRQAAAAAGIARFTPHRPPLPIAYGTHHSKAFLLLYPSGLRLIIHTANLIHPDCNNKTQGLWHQDFPLKSATAPPTSEFESSLAAYLTKLSLPAPTAREVLAAVKQHDFSGAAAKLVASVPGYHNGAALNAYGHMRVRSLLVQEELGEEYRSAPVVAQCSSLGSLDENWLLGEFGASLAAGRYSQPGGLQPPTRLSPQQMQIVWPTVEEVRGSLEGWSAGCSIPGSEKNVSKAFLQRHWHRFGGSVVGRGRAMPHIKTYTRYIGPRMPWFLLASHNLSKAAWGALQKGGQQLMVRSYELAVLLLPSSAAAAAAHPNFAFTCTPPMPVAAANYAAAASPDTASTSASAMAAARVSPAAAAAAAAMARAAASAPASPAQGASPSPIFTAASVASPAVMGAGSGCNQSAPLTASGNKEAQGTGDLSQGSIVPDVAAAAAPLGRPQPLEQPASAPRRMVFMSWEGRLDAAASERGLGGQELCGVGMKATGGSTGDSTAAGRTQQRDVLYLPVPYNLPPVRYSPGDRPWMCDVQYPGLDSLGRPWGSPWQFYGLLEDERQ